MPPIKTLPEVPRMIIHVEFTKPFMILPDDVKRSRVIKMKGRIKLCSTLIH